MTVVPVTVTAVAIVIIIITMIRITLYELIKHAKLSSFVASAVATAASICCMRSLHLRCRCKGIDARQVHSGCMPHDCKKRQAAISGSNVVVQWHTEGVDGATQHNPQGRRVNTEPMID